MPRKKLTKEEKEARLDDIVLYRSYGSTFTFIAERHGISRQAIQQIYAQYQRKLAARENGAGGDGVE